MSLPLELTNTEAIFLSASHSNEPALAQCLMGFFLSTGMRTIEICQIQVQDIIEISGQIHEKMIVRGNAEREIYLTNPKLKTLIVNYVNNRRKDGYHRNCFRCFSPTAPFFLRSNGTTFQLSARKTNRGHISLSCPTLNQLIKVILKDAGIQSPSIDSGRRTLALKLKYQVDKKVIHNLLGNKDIATTNRLLSSKPLNMKQISEITLS